ncbi:MAG: DUF1385 domain-containing protein [Candidatus Syntrophonatronum acetioxidans]|uniref:DUF1385 domain-containing protein n=1 Tax=Candidatus Syntrophonatronum acetioxidans TaxID=1795816 RepID=A0A424YFX3_9FIRM|nr:MAG: DUF1385 domain-containing protein [Candidatus Syntrophonatronum acetioxidans]
MMRDQGEMTIAVRRPDESIHLCREEISSLAQKWPLFKLPVFRGILAFFESLVLGIKALNFSADQALEEEEEKLEGWQMGLTMALALLFGISLFIILPTFIIRYLSSGYEGIPLVMNLGEGLLRIAIFLGYVVLISRMNDIQRVFQYHGAEHKVIHCYEAGLPLTVENARKFSPLHPRCGTSFLLLVMVISILFFSFFGWPNLFLRIAIRLSFLPLVAGVSYEAIRYLGKTRSSLSTMISYPGMALQKFTTRDPDDYQLEVALEALEPLVEKNLGEKIYPGNLSPVKGREIH